MMQRLLWKTTGTIITSSCLAAWWYRPVPDRKDGLGLARIGWISQFDYHNVKNLQLSLILFLRLIVLHLLFLFRLHLVLLHFLLV